LFVGQILVSPQNLVTSSCRSRQNSSRSRPGCWAFDDFGPGDAGHVTEPGEDSVTELPQQQIPDVLGDRGLAAVTGGMPGADQAAQRPLRLHRPDRPRVALGRILVVPY